MNDFVEIMLLWPLFWGIVFAMLWGALFGFERSDK